MNLEQEILLIKERLAVAESEGRNPLAIQGKFENAFQLISELQNKLDDLNFKINIVKTLIDSKKDECKNECSECALIEDKEQGVIIEKKKPGRPKQAV